MFNSLDQQIENTIFFFLRYYVTISLLLFYLPRVRIALGTYLHYWYSRACIQYITVVLRHCDFTTTIEKKNQITTPQRFVGL